MGFILFNDFKSVFTAAVSDGTLISSIITEGKCSDSSSGTNDYIIELKDIPCQLFFIEKLEGTLEDLLTDIEDLDIN